MFTKKYSVSAVTFSQYVALDLLLIQCHVHTGTRPSRPFSLFEQPEEIPLFPLHQWFMVAKDYCKDRLPEQNHHLNLCYLQRMLSTCIGHQGSIASRTFSCRTIASF
jgi:hypothetical protein